MQRVPLPASGHLVTAHLKQRSLPNTGTPRKGSETRRRLIQDVSVFDTVHITKPSQASRHWSLCEAEVERRNATQSVCKIMHSHTTANDPFKRTCHTFRNACLSVKEFWGITAAITGSTNVLVPHAQPINHVALAAEGNAQTPTSILFKRYSLVIPHAPSGAHLITFICLLVLHTHRSTAFTLDWFTLNLLKFWPQNVNKYVFLMYLSFIFSKRKAVGSSWIDNH